MSPPALDHHGPAGERYTMVLTMSGLDVLVQLRQVSAVPAGLGEYDRVTLAVADRVALRQWAGHLDTLQIARSPLAEARLGYAIGFRDPDGTLLRLYTAPVGDLATADVRPSS
jgi:hypothetical protein